MNFKNGLILVVIVTGGAVASIGRLRQPAGVPMSLGTSRSTSLGLCPVVKLDNRTESFSPRLPHSPPASGEIRQMTIKRLGNFDYETTKTIPADVQAMDGARVRLTGFMQIDSESEHIHAFSLIPALYSCCYGEPPAVQHIVRVTALAGETLEYTDSPITVEGTLTVKEIKEDSYVTGVFKIASTKIAVAPQ